MTHVIVGLFLIALGIWGLFEQWYYVMDFAKGALPVAMVCVGTLSLLLVVFGPSNLKKEKE